MAMTAGPGSARVESSGDRAQDRARAAPGWAPSILRAPLVVKLAGTYALVVIASLVVMAATDHSALRGNRAVILGTALVASLVASVTLARLALRPLAEVERTLMRVREGDYTARVSDSPLADSDMSRLATTFNELLEAVNHDRVRLRELAERVVSQSEDERVRLGRELYDSTAQATAALMLEVTAIASELSDATTRERLERVRGIAATVLEEFREVAGYNEDCLSAVGLTT